MTIHYSIAPDIFTRFPDYCRGVVIARNIRNANAPESLVQSLREAEADLASQLSPETLTSHPRIEAWRSAYRLSGIKPSEFRPSVEALARRVVRKDSLPSISTVVDIGTLLSIRHLLPVGAHAIDVLSQAIDLRLASGDESFEPFGSDVIEHPAPGEIIFVEGNTVLTRRWTWRQAKHTLVVPGTTAVEINVDGLPPLSLADVLHVCQETARLVQDYCGGDVRFEIITRENPRIELS